MQSSRKDDENEIDKEETEENSLQQENVSSQYSEHVVEPGNIPDPVEPQPGTLKGTSNDQPIQQPPNPSVQEPNQNPNEEEVLQIAHR